MHTKVVFQGAKALARIGCVVLRFNFRGVGRSAGALGRRTRRAGRLSRGARLHGRAAPGPRALGCRLLVRLVHRTTVGATDDRVCALIGIAPPVNKYDFTAIKPSTKPKFIIHGEADELIPLKRCGSSTPRCRSRRSSSRSIAPTTCSTGRRARWATRSKNCSRISHAGRSNRLRDPHRGRQGADGAPAHGPARRDGRDRHRGGAAARARRRAVRVRA